MNGNASNFSLFVSRHLDPGSDLHVVLHFSAQPKIPVEHKLDAASPPSQIIQY